MEHSSSNFESVKFPHLLCPNKKDISYKKVIIHSAGHHEDETSAVGLLRVLGITCPLERKLNFTDEEIHDPSIIIIDIGGVYDDSISCYDHHVDAGLPSACMLVLENFVKEGKGKQLLKDKLFTDISQRDTGKLSTQYNETRKSISTVISGLNIVDSNNGYLEAITIYQNIIKGLLFGDSLRDLKLVFEDLEKEVKEKLHGIEKEVQSSKRLSLKDGKQAIVLEKFVPFKFILSYMTSNDLYGIMPNNRKEGTYILFSSDTKNYPIVNKMGSRNGQLTCHINGFLGTFINLQSIKKYLHII